MASDDIDVKKEDQVNINRFSRLNTQFHDLEDEIEQLKAELEKYSNATEELMICMDSDGLQLKIGESFFKVDEDTASEYIEDLKSQAEAKLAAKSEQSDALSEEMTKLKSMLYAKFGSSINLEDK